MKNGYFCVLVAVGAFAASASAEAAVHRVYPGDSIQAAIDAASPGDTILVEPGEYGELTYDGTDRYGLRITTDNLRLIGKSNKGKGKANKVRLIAYGDQETGVYAAPPGCDYDVQDNSELGADCRSRALKDFYIRGFTVEGFPKNGIQTRWVDGFEVVRNESAGNGWDNGNGIYPTLSANGLVRDNVSYGSVDTAMWIAGSENVRVIGNELYDSVIGFEITVSNNVTVIQNRIYENTIGVGLFHPDGAGNPPLDEMTDWVIEHNDIYDNNRPNDAPPNSFQSILPPGIGILASGVSGHVIAKNNVEGNDYVGIALLGWCTGLGIVDPGKCQVPPLKGPPQSRNNLITQNYLFENGTLPVPPPGGALPPADLVYAQVFEQIIGLDTSGNCFEKNKPKDGFTIFSLEPDGELPTDGC